MKMEKKAQEKVSIKAVELKLLAVYEENRIVLDESFITPDITTRTHEDKQLFIEIYVTHKKNDHHIELLRKHRLNTMEIVPN